MSEEPETGIIFVHVDAKIIGRDRPGSPKTVLVAFKIIPDGESVVKEFQLYMPETDVGELLAIDLAVDALKNRKGRFVLLCDHESVVSMVNRTEMKVRPKTRPILVQVRKKLESNSSHQSDLLIEVRHFPSNQPTSSQTNTGTASSLAGSSRVSKPFRAVLRVQCTSARMRGMMVNLEVETKARRTA